MEKICVKWMFRSREKGKQIGVNEPQQQKEKARFKLNALHDDNITEKNGFKLKEISLGVWIFLIYDRS